MVAPRVQDQERPLDLVEILRGLLADLGAVEEPDVAASRMSLTLTDHPRSL
jgi:hypothetical protein